MCHTIRYIYSVCGHDKVRDRICSSRNQAEQGGWCYSCFNPPACDGVPVVQRMPQFVYGFCRACHDYYASLGHDTRDSAAILNYWQFKLDKGLDWPVNATSVPDDAIFARPHRKEMAPTQASYQLAALDQSLNWLPRASRQRRLDYLEHVRRCTLEWAGSSSPHNSHCSQPQQVELEQETATMEPESGGYIAHQPTPFLPMTSPTGHKHSVSEPARRNSAARSRNCFSPQQPKTQAMVDENGASSVSSIRSGSLALMGGDDVSLNSDHDVSELSLDHIDPGFSPAFGSSNLFRGGSRLEKTAAVISTIDTAVVSPSPIRGYLELEHILELASLGGSEPPVVADSSSSVAKESPRVRTRPVNLRVITGLHFSGHSGPLPVLAAPGSSTLSGVLPSRLPSSCPSPECNDTGKDVDDVPVNVKTYWGE